jgi:hypothetical protein
MRYVDEEFVPCEEFIGLFEPPNTTGATLATCIKDVCLRLQLPLSMLRGQTYDGASNMSGEHRGCQAIICQEQPLALYVHCGAHCINLVSAAVSDSCPSVRNALQVLNDLGVLFSQSIVARSTFSAIVDTDFRSQHAKQIRPLCPTRWLVRVRAIECLLTQYPQVLECLDELDKPGNILAARAAGLKSQLCSASTLFALQMAKEVFTPLENLNRSLQASYQTVAGMLEAIEMTQQELLALRTDDSFNAKLACLVHKQEEWDLDALQVPRQRKPPARLTGPANSFVAVSVEDYYRPIYFALLDSAIAQLRERFSDSAGLLRYSKLEQVLFSGNVDACREILVRYPEFNLDDLAAQLRMFRRTRPVPTVSAAVALLQQMAPEVRAEFAQVCTLTRLLHVSPASSASAERSFSALRRLKTWIRTTMTEVRLNSLCVCHINKSYMDTIDLKQLMETFVSVNDNRKDMFGKFLQHKHVLSARSR